jgi:hypothetical protein
VTDARLRALAHGAAHGDVMASAGLLRERVRLGELAESRLRLAAYLGDPAAGLATGVAPTVDDPADWVCGLGFAHGIPIVLRVLAAALVARIDTCAHPFDRDHVHELANATEAWFLEPTTENNGRVRWAAIVMCRGHSAMELLHAVLYLTSAWSVSRTLDRREFEVVIPFVRGLRVERVGDLYANRFVPWALEGSK